MFFTRLQFSKMVIALQDFFSKDAAFALVFEMFLRFQNRAGFLAFLSCAILGDAYCLIYQQLRFRCPHCGWLLPFRHWSVPHCCPGCGRELNAPGR